MAANLKLHELTGSPNSVKTRIALGYKGLEYDRLPVSLDAFPGNRAEIVRISRQPRLPVLQHDKTVVFDSGAIMRYLESNFPETPALFSQDHAEHGKIEEMEIYARTQIGEVVGMLFAQAFAPQPDPAVIERANKLLGDRTGLFEDRLSTGDFLVGGRMTAADVACAAPLYLADLTEEAGRSHPISTFFFENMKLGANREKTRAWTRRVLAHDPLNKR